jgi:lipid-A-disaccharide synthase
MVNLIAGREIVPELVQGMFTVQNVVEHLQKVICDGSDRDTMLEGLGQVKTALLAPASADDREPAERAAEIVLSIMATKGTAR